MNITELRNKYHQKICKDIIRIEVSKNGEEYPNFADVNSNLSKILAWKILHKVNYIQNYPSGGYDQAVVRNFDITTCEFIQTTFTFLQHLRPGDWQYTTNKTNFSNFDQFIIMSRLPVEDEEINQSGILSNEPGQHAKLTPLRKNNNLKGRPLLHAIISCKWTLRSDRAQNTRTEALNLIRNRKGHLPHIVAVTAEPYPARISTLALGTGDIDCVYHFALPELISAVHEAKDESSIDLIEIMVEGRRLRDISDLPFDLAA